MDGIKHEVFESANTASGWVFFCQGSERGGIDQLLIFVKGTAKGSMFVEGLEFLITPIHVLTKNPEHLKAEVATSFSDEDRGNHSQLLLLLGNPEAHQAFI